MDATAGIYGEPYGRAQLGPLFPKHPLSQIDPAIYSLHKEKKTKTRIWYDATYFNAMNLYKFFL